MYVWLQCYVGKKIEIPLPKYITDYNKTVHDSNVSLAISIAWNGIEIGNTSYLDNMNSTIKFDKCVVHHLHSTCIHLVCKFGYNIYGDNRITFHVRLAQHKTVYRILSLTQSERWPSAAWPLSRCKQLTKSASIQRRKTGCFDIIKALPQAHYGKKDADFGPQKNKFHYSVLPCSGKVIAESGKIQNL